MNRRIATLLVALLPVVVLGVLGSTVVVPFAALGPGPTFDTLGEVEGTEVVDIEDPTGATSIDEPSGHLNMTTVAVRDGLTVFDALGLWLSGRQGLVPRDQVYPPDRSREEVEQANQADFARSEDSAELAALRYLDLPTDLTIAEVGEDVPAAGVLRDGDRVTTVNGTAVTTAEDVRNAVGALSPGDEVIVDGVRGDVPFTETVPVGPRPDDGERGYLGVTLVEEPDVPFDVTFNLADVGGPSAGLMFTLAVIDKLSPGDLSGGAFVAGTGTIDPDGTVGPIGGIPYKLVAAREAGATTFLVPADNCAEAAASVPDGLRLVRVTDVGGAVDALGSLAEGGDAPSCS
ncbi:YlbL family protein [Rhodococcoides corynebacterioides]|uniref:YlbL family protein n=1 Tax=Rhodococcoides corynebacterioides TaxID=53972 RepID=UPI001C9B290E|nr:PDZ domain-containing protein [Rhodococcus corynebacterioides]MBY6349844.1 PDZ domain-containing protein [Rhodococcus corynebacterioides]